MDQGEQRLVHRRQEGVLKATISTVSPHLSRGLSQPARVSVVHASATALSARPRKRPTCFTHFGRFPARSPQYEDISPLLRPICVFRYICEKCPQRNGCESSIPVSEKAVPPGFVALSYESLGTDGPN